jgi:hypothetical protein
MLGSLRIRRRSARRIELTVSRATHLVGWLASGAGALGGAWLFAYSLFAAILAGLFALGGVVVATMRHDLCFDREDGVLRIDQRLAGVPRHAVVPLFHLKAIVVKARASGRGFEALIERRVGEPILLDTDDHPGPLYQLAQAVSDVAGLRLVYDATARAAST